MDRAKKIFEKYTKDELLSIINDSKKLAAKSIHYVLSDLIREKCGDEDLEEEVEQLSPYNHCGFIEIKFKDEIGYRLNICLSKVLANYKATIDVPEEYAKQVLDEYNSLKLAALTYFGFFLTDYKEVVGRIEKSLGHSLDLIIDDNNPTTMYFDKSSNSRIGIFPFYVDSNGLPLRK